MTQLRSFVCALATLALLAGACSSGSDVAAVDESAVETEVAATAAPDPTPEPDPEPEPTDEPAPEPTAAPTPEPTPEPAPEPVADIRDGRDFTAVTSTVEEFVADKGLNGAGLIIVHRDDGVLYQQSFGEFTDDRISLIASSSKMISAGVVLAMQERGLLDINAPIADYVPWASGDESGITAAQLISNSSGLVGLGPDLLYGPYFCQWTPTTELEACGETVYAGPDDDADVIAPDTEFRYGGAQWQVAGAVAETVSGQTWEELVNEIYVEPCGVDSLGYISLGSVFTGAPGYPTTFAGDPDGVAPTENPNIEGGAYIDAGDYGTLLLMHLRGGSCDGNQVLQAESINTMHTDRIAAVYDGNAGGPDVGYGMGWWVDRTTGRISDGGAFGTVPWLDLDDGYGAYLVIEDESGTGQELSMLLEDLVHEAVTG